MNNFFIVGAPRSGTTFIVKLFNTSTNAKVFSEQSPKLGYESRERHLGHFNSNEEAENFIKVQKEEHIKYVNDSGYIYGDKNPNYLPFVKDILHVWKEVKFVFVYRDGRDVVRSLINWSYTGRKLFDMEEDNGTGIKYPIQNLWDYSRLRPKKGEKYHKNWKKYSLFEKCCINWSYYNIYLLKICSEIPSDKFITINTTDSDINSYNRVFNFLDLLGFKEKKLKKLKSSNVNTSLQDNDINYFESYKDWTNEQREIYEKYCKETHIKLFGELNW